AAQGRPSLGEQYLLDRHGNAVQEPGRGTVAPAFLGLPGAGQCGLPIDQAERVHLPVELVDAFQGVFGGLHRREVTGAVGGHQVGGREVGGRRTNGGGHAGFRSHVAVLTWLFSRGCFHVAVLTYPWVLSTTLRNGCPPRYRSRFSANRSTSASRQPITSPDMCGETITPGRVHSGCPAGSGSVAKTSSAAPANRPERSASTRSSSTTSAPRPTLIRRACAGSRASSAASTRPAVRAVSGAASTNQAQSPSSPGNSSAAWTPSRACRPTRLTRIPTARNIAAIAAPIGPPPTTTALEPATVSVSRWRHCRRACRPRVVGRSFA